MVIDAMFAANLHRDLSWGQAICFLRINATVVENTNGKNK
jgi:hypothetical protein